MTIISALPFTLQNGATADATQVMANLDDIVDDVNSNAAHNGVNADITALTALTTPITPAQGGTPVYIGGTSAGTANAQTVASPTPTGFSLTAGNRITFIAGYTNTTAMTLSVNSTTATAVRKLGQAGLEALTGGEVFLGNTVEAIYDGTYMVLLTDAVNTIGPLTSLASATSTDLGTISSHNVNVTGTTTITGFGSTAVTANPLYYVRFNAALLLTYNATSLILPGAANITTVAGDWAIAQYSGSSNWVVTHYQRASGVAVVNPSPMSGAQGLLIQNNSGTPNTSIDITADQAVMLTTGAVPIYASAVSVTINATTTGANGLDAGSLANSTWYYVFLISNGSATAGLLSTSATAPTMPSGYTYKVYLGEMRTGGAATLLRTQQRGNTVRYIVVTASNTPALPAIISSASAIGTYSQTAPTWVAESVSSVVPPTATRVALTWSANRRGGGVSAIQIAANNSYGGYQSASDNIPFFDGAPGGVLGGGMSGELYLESSNIYVASGGVILVSAAGWTNKVNAN